jgi:hypothetical protein
VPKNRLAVSWPSLPVLSFGQTEKYIYALVGTLHTKVSVLDLLHSQITSRLIAKRIKYAEPQLWLLDLMVYRFNQTFNDVILCVERFHGFPFSFYLLIQKQIKFQLAGFFFDFISFELWIENIRAKLSDFHFEILSYQNFIVLFLLILILFQQWLNRFWLIV